MHHCDNLLIRCMDFRLNKMFKDFAAAEFDDNYDLISVAGGAKAIVAEETSAAILAMIELFQYKHGGKTVYLTSHLDCGAYGGKAAFQSYNQEKQAILADLNQAAAVIKDRFPELEIKILLASLKGDRFDLELT